MNGNETFIVIIVLICAYSLIEKYIERKYK